jgi:hypothetical protein
VTYFSFNHEELLLWCDSVLLRAETPQVLIDRLVNMTHSTVQPLCLMAESIIEDVVFCLEPRNLTANHTLDSYVLRIRSSAELQAPPNPPATPGPTYYSRRKREK